MTWEEAAQLTEHIAATPDAGNWHAQVAVRGDDYAVAVRHHNTPTSYYVTSVREFIALCDRLMTTGHA